MDIPLSKMNFETNLSITIVKNIKLKWSYKMLTQ